METNKTACDLGGGGGGMWAVQSYSRDEGVQRVTMTGLLSNLGHHNPSCKEKSNIVSDSQPQVLPMSYGQRPGMPHLTPDNPATRAGETVGMKFCSSIAVNKSLGFQASPTWG